MKFLKILVGTLGLLFCIVVGLNIYTSSRKTKTEIKYSDKYFRNVDGNFITMTDKQQSLVRKNISKIAKGMSENEVYLNFGEPTYTEELGTKEGKFIGWLLAYFFVKQKEGFIKTDDKYLEIFLGPDKKVDKVATSIKELRMANWGEDFYIKGIDELKSKTK